MEEESATLTLTPVTSGNLSPSILKNAPSIMFSKHSKVPSLEGNSVDPQSSVMYTVEGIS